ncbi:glycosyltransferase family 2 protein [Paenibacillus sp.]|uniref:glycosyltransferase family 2 protein n=1 Tax=Paenibacillus sp. TaxID=58172 RepID=UPI00281223F4|nr:glycosyltransferase family 2 protein [Paenibacillus sp.]
MERLEASSKWDVPAFETLELREKRSKYCICVPVINEGEKIRKQIDKMGHFANDVDIIILDGGSTDGSLEEGFLRKMGVRALLTKRGPGKLSAQLRMGFAYALMEGYEGVITVDGNNKDSIESIPQFILELDNGYDFVQGSRYIPGGVEENTPLSRKLAIRLIHAPFISLIAGFRYTDTTNGYRAHSRRYLAHPEVLPFRDIFNTYELLAYLSVRAPQLHLKVKETPVKRSYPATGKIPTKISPLRGNMLLMQILWKLARRKYHP